MAAVKFIQPDVAEKYETSVEDDHVVSVKGYTTKLSAISLPMAKMLIESGFKGIQEKAAAKDDKKK